MPSRTQVGSVLAATHLAVGAWGWFGGGDRIAAFVAGTIYLPLWPFAELGVPVFRPTGWMFPIVTTLGWAIVLTLWAGVYWYLAAVILWIVRRWRTD